jgi:hypothetical protein
MQQLSAPTGIGQAGNDQLLKSHKLSLCVTTGLQAQSGNQEQQEGQAPRRLQREDTKTHLYGRRWADRTFRASGLKGDNLPLLTFGHVDGDALYFQQARHTAAATPYRRRFLVSATLRSPGGLGGGIGSDRGAGGSSFTRIALRRRTRGDNGKRSAAIVPRSRSARVTLSSSVRSGVIAGL